MTDMRAELEAAYMALLASHDGRAHVSLDAVAAALLPANASHEEIDAFVERLERAGKVVGAPTEVKLKDALLKVLRTARELAKVGEKSPSVGRIAEAASLDPALVKLALVFGQTLGR